MNRILRLLVALLRVWTCRPRPVRPPRYYTHQEEVSGYWRKGRWVAGYRSRR